MNVIFDKNNVPNFTGDARATMVELALAEHEKTSPLTEQDRQIFMIAGLRSLDQMETVLRRVLMLGEAEPFNGDGAIESSKDFLAACQERFRSGKSTPFYFGKRNIAETRTVLIG